MRQAHIVSRHYFNQTLFWRIWLLEVACSEIRTGLISSTFWRITACRWFTPFDGNTCKNRNCTFFLWFSKICHIHLFTINRNSACGQASSAVTSGTSVSSKGNDERGRKDHSSVAGLICCQEARDALRGLISEAAKYRQPFIAHDRPHAMGKLGTHTLVVASQREIFCHRRIHKGPSQPYDSLELCDVKTCS